LPLKALGAGELLVGVPAEAHVSFGFHGLCGPVPLAAARLEAISELLQLAVVLNAGGGCLSIQPQLFSLQSQFPFLPLKCGSAGEPLFLGIKRQGPAAKPAALAWILDLHGALQGVALFQGVPFQAGSREQLRRGLGAAAGGTASVGARVSMPTLTLVPSWALVNQAASVHCAADRGPTDH
jgi:hypothetical protein